MNPVKSISRYLGEISLTTVIAAGAIWLLMLTTSSTFALIFAAESSNGVSNLLKSGKTKTNYDVQYLTSLVQKQGIIIRTLRNVQNFDHKQTQHQLGQQRNGTRLIADAIVSIETHLDKTLQSDINRSASSVERQVLLFDQTVLIPSLEKAIS